MVSLFINALLSLAVTNAPEQCLCAKAPPFGVVVKVWRCRNGIWMPRAWWSFRVVSSRWAPCPLLCKRSLCVLESDTGCQSAVQPS
jgi:hypothetical protein